MKPLALVAVVFTAAVFVGFVRDNKGETILCIMSEYLDKIEENLPTCRPSKTDYCLGTCQTSSFQTNSTCLWAAQKP